MKLKRFAAIFVMFFVNICSADYQAICVNEQLFFTINDPADSITNIQLLDSDSQVLYEYSIKSELHPDAVIKSVLIDHSYIIGISSVYTNECDVNLPA